MTIAKGMPAPSVKRLRLVPFLPRSVGLAPVADFPRGAFVIAPSTACHSHWIPSSSSYTCSPACHHLRKKPFCSHCLSAIMYGRTGSQCSWQRILPRYQFVAQRQERHMLALWLLKTNQREVKQRTEKGSYPSPFSTFRAVWIRESEVRSQKIIRVGVKRMSSGLYCGKRACPPSGMACA